MSRFFQGFSLALFREFSRFFQPILLYHKQSKNYYLRARYYNPATGRFTQRDSYLGNKADPLSLNRYTYGRGNPIRYRDPSGRISIGALLGIA